MLKRENWNISKIKILFLLRSINSLVLSHIYNYGIPYSHLDILKFFIIWTFLFQFNFQATFEGPDLNIVSKELRIFDLLDTFHLNSIIFDIHLWEFQRLDLEVFGVAFYDVFDLKIDWVFIVIVAHPLARLFKWTDHLWNALKFEGF